MNAQLSSLVLTFTVLLLTVDEKNRLKNILTPFTATAWPFVIITLLVNFLVHLMGFKMVSARANYFILGNLIIIWLVGYVINYFKGVAPTVEYTKVFAEFYKYKYFFIILSWMIFILTYSRVITLVNAKGGWWYIGTDEFSDDILHGIVAHAIMFAKVCFFFLYAIYINRKKNILYYLTLLILVACIFVAQNKYHLMMILLMVFFLENLQKNIKNQIVQILKIAFSLAFLFFLYFMIVAIGWKTKTFATLKIWDYFFKMFMNYLVSGPINLDVWLNFPISKPDWTLFMPWLDLWNFLIGNPNQIFQVPYLSKGFIPTLKGFHSNVGTSFGVYYMIGGIGFTVMTTTVIAIGSYFFYFKSMISNSPVIQYLNFLFLSLGVLSFFVQYFTLLSLYEMSFSFILVFFILKMINRYVT